MFLVTVNNLYSEIDERYLCESIETRPSTSYKHPDATEVMMFKTALTMANFPHRPDAALSVHTFRPVKVEPVIESVYDRPDGY